MPDLNPLLALVGATLLLSCFGVACLILRDGIPLIDEEDEP